MKSQLLAADNKLMIGSRGGRPSDDLDMLLPLKRPSSLIDLGGSGPLKVYDYIQGPGGSCSGSSTFSKLFFFQCPASCPMDFRNSEIL